ncbi:glycosyltransferase family 4 protein [Paraburkholderia sp. RP-4-7]|uniref:Glycosyltransferase family 4 protein n=1 Tax=Paraburkholderia polaris TaxID=2728848 RepID=A0A848IJP4_9BURK|nr:glycosyltransferase family 4 protein [Paraburkholderia polaris]NMM01951.1 glycosyltransferase family 4 protein [Paraburkholderia polaris]
MNPSRKKIAVVNVFYPPQAIGGATRIVADEVSLLIRNYGEEFDVVVFSTDGYRQPAHIMNVYPHDGIRVYSPSSLWRENMDWYINDPEMERLFGEFIKHEKPDLIHFHCLQRLTASVVDAARKMAIPYYVTAHDAWWISDYQFLTDASGKVYPDGHPDPFIESPLPDGVTRRQSLERRNHLKSLLAAAESVLCVSDAYTRIYKNNGIFKSRTNKNGISNLTNWSAKQTSLSAKVICAHIGGMATHKGFFIFKDAVKSVSTQNIELLVVDDSKSEDYLHKTTWGNTPVTIIGRVAQQRVVELYQRIDVLFAPSICPESFGLVTREAAACGCWLVGSDVGAIGEDISPENGFKITPTVRSLQGVVREIDAAPLKYKGSPITRAPRYSSDQVKELVHMFRETLTEKKND